MVQACSGRRIVDGPAMTRCKIWASEDNRPQDQPANPRLQLFDADADGTGVGATWKKG